MVDFNIRHERFKLERSAARKFALIMIEAKIERRSPVNLHDKHTVSRGGTNGHGIPRLPRSLFNAKRRNLGRDYWDYSVYEGTSQNFCLFIVIIIIILIKRVTVLWYI